MIVQGPREYGPGVSGQAGPRRAGDLGGCQADSRRLAAYPRARPAQW